MSNEILDDFGMKGESFEFFKDFFLLEQAEYLRKLFDEASIPYKIDKRETIIDEAIIGNSLTPKIILRLQPSNFQIANDLIKENLVLDDDYIDTHYLNQLDYKELVEILQKPDEWSVEDGVIAREILANRDVKYSEEEILAMREERFAALRAGKNASKVYIGVYLLTVFILSYILHILFLIAGLGLAWYYWKDRSVDATGFKYFTYNQNTQNFGKIVFFAWLFVVIPFCLFLFPYFATIQLNLLK